tara:strand:+ start:438 stop:719 length:282 start_codon:yes stop_codon:yes gene_type:complete
MGGSLDYRTYDKALTKEQVEEKFEGDQESSAYESGHSYSGQIGVMPHGIDWQTQTFKTVDEAVEWLSSHHDKWDKAFGIITKSAYVVGGVCSS